MSRKQGGFALILLGAVVAFGVAWLVYQQSQQAVATARMESVEVLVAATDIPERTVVVGPFVTVKRMLPTSLPPAAMARPEDALGKMTTGPIMAGEFILPAKLVESDARGGLAYAVPKGKVVITLPASDILSTGAVRVNDTVDLLVTIHPEKQIGVAQPTQTPTRPGTPVAGVAPGATPVATPEGEDVSLGTTQTTMQGMKVLAIGSVVTSAVAPPEQPEKPSATANQAVTATSLITFAVDPQDALTLKALKDSERVKLELVLRAAGDDAVRKTDPVTLRTIVDRYQFRAVPTPAGRQSTPAASTTPTAPRVAP